MGRLNQEHPRRLLRLGLCAALAVGGLPLAACGDAEQGSNARRINTRSDLIGGPSALGEVGDFLIENDEIRLIVQDKGFSRGFGVYGGSLIDIDRQRALDPGDSSGGNGRDQFGELFPIAFLQALVPENVEVINDGSDGETAIVRVSGNGGDFLSLTKALNQAVLNSHELPEQPLDLFGDPETLDGDPKVEYSVDYELAPGAPYVRIRVRMKNITDETIPIPSESGAFVLRLLGIGGDNFGAPLGFVLLFGAGNTVFSPGFGYDIRFSLDDAYAAGSDLPFPALPGLLTNGLISTSKNGISYGFFTLPPEADEATLNFAEQRVDAEGNNLYEQTLGVDIKSDTMLVPFLASSFTGVFYAQAPNELPADAYTEFSAYMAVGNGDVASVMDTMLELRRERGDETPLVELLGAVFDDQTGEPLADTSVVVFDADDKPINQFYTDSFGRFRGTMPAGDYTAKVERDPVVSAPVPFTLSEGEGAKFVTLSGPTAGLVAVRVRDDSGEEIPAKVTVVGTVGADTVGQDYRDFLFDLEVGQEWRTSDTIPDTAEDASTRRYIEAVVYTGKDGQALVEVPPGEPFELYISRGTEYSLSRVEVTADAGRVTNVVSTLTRVVDTSGFISADFHLHASPSLDSSLPFEERVESVVGEGVEVLVATDHNFITDYQPTIDELDLNDWAVGLIGLELTTLESGHFNAYPLQRNVGAITKGAFEWSLKPPDELFTTVKSAGLLGPEDTIVQVNHPRDSILGYFAQYGVDTLNGGIPDPTCAGGLDPSCAVQPNGPAFRDADGASTFSYAFDAMEVLNGSLVDQWHSVRMPESIAGLEIPEDVIGDLPPPGTILCDGDGEVAFPGVIDDWFNMLNLGERYIGTGTSDSHSAEDHTGYFRSYIKVADDSPRAVGAREVVDAMKSRHLIMTNGPFLDFTLDGATMGQDVAIDDGTVQLAVDVRVAPWVDVDYGMVWANGEEIHRFDVAVGEDGTFKYETELELSRDAWVVVEVRGDGPMFPIVRPIDIPPVALSDAFGSIAGSLGLFSAGGLGELEPTRTGTFTPIALTNPIWVDTDGNGFDPPGALPRECRGYGVVTEKFGRIAPPDIIGRRPAPAIINSFGFPRLYGDIQDVRTLFEQFGRHTH